MTAQLAIILFFFLGILALLFMGAVCIRLDAIIKLLRDQTKADGSMT